MIKLWKKFDGWILEIENGIEIKAVSFGIIYVHLCKLPPLIYVCFASNLSFNLAFRDLTSHCYKNQLQKWHLHLVVNDFIWSVEASFTKIKIIICYTFSSVVWRFVIEIHAPPRDKTNKMARAPSVDSDQPGHLPSLIRIFAVRSMGSWGPRLSSCGQRRL